MPRIALSVSRISSRRISPIQKLFDHRPLAAGWSHKRMHPTLTLIHKPHRAHLQSYIHDPDKDEDGAISALDDNVTPPSVVRMFVLSFPPRISRNCQVWQPEKSGSPLSALSWHHQTHFCIRKINVKGNTGTSTILECQITWSTTPRPVSPLFLKSRAVASSANTSGQCLSALCACLKNNDADRCMFHRSPVSDI